MQRRAFSFAAALALAAVATLTHLPANPGHHSSCEECRASCNNIPMDPTDCLNLYCPECATVTSTDHPQAAPEVPAP
jgi:hypothetical protein